MSSKKYLFILLLFLFGCGAQEETFKQTEQKGSIEAYEIFISKYPKGEFTEKARKKLYSLAYEAARQKDTIEAYEIFINRYSGSDLTSSALKRLKYLRWPNIGDCIEATRKSCVSIWCVAHDYYKFKGIITGKMGSSYAVKIVSINHRSTGVFGPENWIDTNSAISWSGDSTYRGEVIEIPKNVLSRCD